MGRQIQDTAFSDFKDMEANGFSGFHTIAELNTDPSSIPALPGVYMVLYRGYMTPSFLKKNNAGTGEDLSENIDLLKGRWIAQSVVLYIGKTSGMGYTATLQHRIRELLAFGQGNAGHHREGHAIWQLSNSGDLMICWKVLDQENPEQVETAMIETFQKQFGKKPFANS
jgi:hypothetical protein